MPLLAIDSSSELLSVAVEAGGQITSRAVRGHERHSVHAAVVVAQTLAEAKVEPPTLKKILVSQGPGSFTGLRVGYALAKGLSCGAHIPIAPFDPFLVAAYGLRSQASVVFVLADARRDEAFVGAYRTADQELPRIVADVEIRPLALLSGWIDDVLGSEGVERSGAMLAVDPSWRDAVTANVPGLAASDVPEVAPLALERNRAGEGPAVSYSATESALLTPRYIRRVSALTIVERKAQGIHK